MTGLIVLAIMLMTAGALPTSSRVCPVSGARRDGSKQQHCGQEQNRSKCDVRHS